MIKTFAQLIEEVRRARRDLVVAVPMADDEAALSAVAMARREGIARGLLFGPKAKIEAVLREEKISAEGLEIVEVADAERAAAAAVAAVRQGRAQMLLKGSLPTAQLLKAALDAEGGLRTGRLLSDVFLYENRLSPTGKLTGLTDGGVNLAPDLKQKKEIVQNAVEVFHRLGVACPKVACVCAVEKVNPKMPATLDAAALVEMNRRGDLGGCEVGGPFGLDNALVKACALAKGIDSPVAGDPDILLAPNIEAGNMFAKGVVYYAKVDPGHVIMGAAAPILINSRVDTPAAKLYSIALGALCSLPAKKG